MQGYLLLSGQVFDQPPPPPPPVCPSPPPPPPPALPWAAPSDFTQTAGLGHSLHLAHGEWHWPGGNNALDQYGTCHPALQVEGTLAVLGTLLIRGDILWEQEHGNIRSLREWYGVEKAQRTLPCVHGNLNLTDGNCLCSPHWRGPSCDVHDCYDHGEWVLARRTCACDPPWDAHQLCATRHCVDYNTTSTAVYTEQDHVACLADYNASGCGTHMMTCQGICDHDRCICYVPGSTGLTCSAMCGTPVIDGLACPGRVNWGLSYTNNSAGIAVCGGGYDAFDSTIVTIKAVMCGPNITACLANFHLNSHLCCAPGIICQDLLNIPGPWVSWTYTDTMPGPTLFNLGTRATTLMIYQRYCNTLVLYPNMSCLRNAYLALQAEPWEALGAGVVYTSAAYVLGGPTLFVTFDVSLLPLTPARMAATAMPMYFTPTNIPDPYSVGQQLFYVLAYPQMGNPFCMRDNTTLTLLQGDHNTVVYWYRLEDSPGIYLDQADYCGKFSLYNNTVRKQSDGAYLSAGLILQWTPEAASMPIQSMS